MSGPTVPPVPDDNSAHNPKRQRRRRRIKALRRATGIPPRSSHGWQRPLVVLAILAVAGIWFAAFVYVLNAVARPAPG